MSENKTNDAVDNAARLNAAIQLCQIQMEHFRSTRSIEWEITIAMWTLLALATYAASQQPIPIFTGLVFAGVIFLVGIHAAALNFLRDSQAFDKHLWKQYRVHAESIGDLKTDKLDQDHSHQWVALEVVVSVILGICAVTASLNQSESLFVVEPIDTETWQAWRIANPDRKVAGPSPQDALKALRDREGHRSP
jgi:hypothetical protein